jgi:hypothetical protein
MPYNNSIFQNRADKREIEGTKTSGGCEKASVALYETHDF